MIGRRRPFAPGLARGPCPPCPPPPVPLAPLSLTLAYLAANGTITDDTFTGLTTLTDPPDATWSATINRTATTSTAQGRVYEVPVPHAYIGPGGTVLVYGEIGRPAGTTPNYGVSIDCALVDSDAGHTSVPYVRFSRGFAVGVQTYVSRVANRTGGTVSGNDTRTYGAANQPRAALFTLARVPDGSGLQRATVTGIGQPSNDDDATTGGLLPTWATDWRRIPRMVTAIAVGAAQPERSPSLGIGLAALAQVGTTRLILRLGAQSSIVHSSPLRILILPPEGP